MMYRHPLFVALFYCFMITKVNYFAETNSKELIKISEQNGKQAVSARELHSFLESKQDFSTWIKARIEKYGFVDNIDFTLHKFMEGKVWKHEYVLTVDCAKEIAMVEGNEKGKEARKYFIEVERIFKNNLSAFENDPFIQLRMYQIQQQTQLNILENKVNLLEAKTTTRPDYFTVTAYAVINKITVGLTLASKIGRKASAICKKNGFPVDETPDPRFGKVKVYPKSVLDDVFNMEIFA